MDKEKYSFIRTRRNWENFSNLFVNSKSTNDSNNCNISCIFENSSDTIVQWKTASSTFKNNLDLTDENNATCNISMNSSTAEFLRRCNFIVRDEYTILHKGGIYAVDRLLK